MANRVTPSDVKEIYNTTLADVVIEPYIDVANDLVTEKLATDWFSDTRLAMIEKFLAAHLIVSTRDRQAVEEEIGEARVQYANVFKEGLKSTSYGQTVLMLDTSGTFNSMSKRKVRIVAIESFDD
jgi:hypothetical protein